MTMTDPRGGEAVPDLTEQQALRLVAPDHRYSRVLAFGTVGATGAVLVDPNGDGNHLEYNELSYEDGRWCAGVSRGSGCPPGYGVVSLGEVDSGTEPRYAYGLAEAPGPITVAVAGRSVDVVANDRGWWLWLWPGMW